jgi:Phosphotransferase enzyme family
MESLRAETNTYRLIVTRRNASEIFLLPNGSGLAIPRVDIRPHKRLAEQLTGEVSKAWGLDAYCLLIPNLPICSRDGMPKYAVMESVRQNNNAPTGTSWVRRVAVDPCVQGEEGRVIQEALKEIRAYAEDERVGPFARPGWLAELFRWAQEQIAPLHLRLTGAFQQLNASPTFSLIRLETDGEAVWFKATGEPNSHELHATVALARLFPHSVPQILGVHRSWNGWLSAEAAGVSLDQVTDFPAWERAAEEFAELQIVSIRKTSELLRAGAKDLRIARLLERIDPFLSRMKELMAAQETTIPVPLAKCELRTLARRLKESCLLLESLPLPDTLGHLDLNPGNILVTEDRCVFLDWAEGCVTSPLLSFEYLREHMARTGISEPAPGGRLAAAYLRPWASLYSPDDLRCALRLSPLIAVFACAVASDSWRSTDIVHNPGLPGYFRSLTRRMYREATVVAERSELCLD